MRACVRALTLHGPDVMDGPLSLVKLGAASAPCTVGVFWDVGGKQMGDGMRTGGTDGFRMGREGERVCVNKGGGGGGVAFFSHLSPLQVHQ